MRFGAFISLLGSIVVLHSGAAIAYDPSSGKPNALERLAQSHINHPYLPFARYALEQAERRAADREVRSAVLVEPVSLIEPKAIACGSKPMAVLIDMDAATGETIIEGEPYGFGELLQALRETDISIGWITDRGVGTSEAELALLSSGETPVMQSGDIELIAYPSLSKQQLRQGLAASHCVLAIAGDQRSDFDELYNYLRDPDFAIRLEAWIGRGWFLLPYPAAVADANPPPEDTEVDERP